MPKGKSNDEERKQVLKSKASFMRSRRVAKGHTGRQDVEHTGRTARPSQAVTGQEARTSRTGARKRMASSG